MGILSYYPENLSEHDREPDKRIFRHSLIFASFFVALFWLVKIIEQIFGLDLYHGGIYPLHVKGLLGIFTALLIHSGYNHLISNSVPFFILLFALVYFYRKIFVQDFLPDIYTLRSLCLAGRT